ncbi:unnamed protein product [Hydatigera taeniaeformis]|uniref:DUF2428 domain-containing protein n=1 Tax=Hydatigena taeniaeformis TaxID=6205 RepID=A0A0R3X2R2_HYDTA|nr:unnamed protein product [Hydatigera taeniaeformis]
MTRSDFPSRRLSVTFGVISVVSDSEFADIACSMLHQIAPQDGKSTDTSFINQLTSNDELAPIFEFIFNHQNDPIDAVREALMDTFEILVSLLAMCSPATVASPFLQSLLNRVLEQPLWMRNTLILIHRFFASIFKETSQTSEQAIEWLVFAGFPLIYMEHPTDLSLSATRSFALGCTLISAANDVALSQPAGEVFALLALHFSSMESEAMRAWFLAIVWMAKHLCGVPHAFLDKVFNLAPTLPSALIKNYSQYFTEEGLSTLLHSYRYCLTKKGLKRLPITPPDLILISRALRSQDRQLNQETVGVIELLLCQAHINDGDLIHLFIQAIDVGICCFDHAACSKMCNAITRVTEYFLSLLHRMKSSAKQNQAFDNAMVGLLSSYGSTELRNFGLINVLGLQETFKRVASAILLHLHPGGVPTHVTNALAFLVSFVEVLLSNETENGALSLCPTFHFLLNNLFLAAAKQILSTTLPLTNQWFGLTVRNELDSKLFGIGSYVYHCILSVGLSQPLILLCSAMSELTGGFDENNDRSAEILLTSLMACLWSTFSKDRDNAQKLILRLGLLKYMKPTSLVWLWRKALTEVGRSVRPDVNAVGGHLVLTLLAAPSLSSMEIELGGGDVGVALLATSGTAVRAVVAVHHLLSILNDQIRVAEASGDGLLMVSVTGPFYPLLNIIRTLIHDPGHCMPSRRVNTDSITLRSHNCFVFILSFSRWLFENPPPESLPVSLSKDSICNRLLDVAMRIARICSFVVFHSSPEGVLILLDEVGRNAKVIPSGAGNEDLWNKESIALMNYSVADAESAYVLRRAVKRPEHLVVNCWRSVREVALLLGGRLTRDALLSDPSSSQLNFAQASSSKYQLIRSRHPGAFELTASGFQSFCEILLRVRHCQDVCQWPEQWLSVVIADLTSTVIRPVASQIGRLPLKYLQDYTYCSTRRSAGLPFFVQTLLVALHKTSQLSVLLNRTVRALLAELNGETEATTVPSDCKARIRLPVVERRLHVINVLRALVRDATIGPLLKIHLEAILVCTFEGLDSSLWMIRNAALMLYSALMERIFGVNRTRDCESNKNRMASSVFFAKFPGMRDFMLKSFEKAIGGLYSPSIGRAKLFALLNFLKRLLPPIQQATANGVMVQAFVPLVFSMQMPNWLFVTSADRCAGAADVRIRMIAARSLIAVLQPARLSYVARQILLIVSPYFTSHSSCLQTNFVHGMLLQVRLTSLLTMSYYVAFGFLEILKCEYFPIGDADAMQNSPHHAYLSEISALLSDMIAVCMDSSTNLCPIIKQTCLACGLSFGLPAMVASIKPKRYRPLSAPCALDSSAMELLVQLCSAFKDGHSSLQRIVKDVFDGTSPELKRITLGLLVRRLNGNDVLFSRCWRLLWYEDAVNLLSEISAPPFHTKPNGERLELSAYSSLLVDAIIAFGNRSHRPHTLIGFHASQLLAYLATTSTSDQPLTHNKLLAHCRQLFTSNEGIPVHLGPLLTVYALISQNKEEALDCLARCIDPKHHCPYWSTRAEALLAVDRFMSQNIENKICVHCHIRINLAVLRNLFLEADDEVLMIASTTAFQILPKSDELPQKPLPPVIRPAFLFNFISMFKYPAVSILLDWFNEELKEKTEHCGDFENASGVFVTDESTTSTSIVVFATLLCSALKEWALVSPQADKITFMLDQICRRGLAQLSTKPSSEGDFSHSIGSDTLLRVVTQLFARLQRDLQEESDV